MTAVKINKGDVVKVAPSGTYGIIVSIQEVHNRFQLYGVSGWQYGLDKLEKSAATDLLEENMRQSSRLETMAKKAAESFEVAVEEAQEKERLEKDQKEFARVIARNLIAWDTSKDKGEGLLPEVYLTNKVLYKKLTGEEYYKDRAIAKFDI
jgi:hypothetical protein